MKFHSFKCALKYINIFINKLTINYNKINYLINIFEDLNQTSIAKIIIFKPWGFSSHFGILTLCGSHPNYYSRHSNLVI